MRDTQGPFALLVLAALAAPLSAQDDEMFFDDDLDALIDGEVVDEAGPQTGVLRGFQGFVALEPRIYFRDRNQGRNDEQLVFRTEFELDFRFSEDWTGFFRPRVLVDLFDGDYSRFEPFEGYVTYEQEVWDVRGGSFIENWGIVDTFNPIDVLNRRDFGSDILDTDRLGEVGFRARGKFDGNSVIGEPTVSAYVLPVWQRTLFAPSDQRFALTIGDLELDEEAGFEPSGSDRVFYGLRLQSTLFTAPFNADVQLIASDGPGRFPAIGIDGSALIPVYFGSTVIGAGIRAVANESVLGSEFAKYTLKAEVAHNINRDYEGAPVAAPDDYTVFVVGVDRVFDGVFTVQDSLTATVEYARENGASDVQAFFRPFRNDVILRAFWEANDFDRKSFEIRGIFDLDNHETIGELIYETQLRSWNDDVKLTTRLQLFDPASVGESLFSVFPNNSSLLVGLRWDF
ncbi:MAG: hypothetical protein AAF726_16265 [Planctomycetota bacterium]